MNKYRVAPAAARTMDGITFDSKAEMKRYQELRMLERAGRVKDIELQPKYVLLAPFTYRKKKYRGITYRADFRYFDSSIGWVVEDVKGYSTDSYRIKKQLLLSQHPEITFREVKV